jgi:micrococcal nuclease
MKKFIFGFLLSAIATIAAAQNSIPAKEAGKHIGEKVIICDKVYGGKYFSGSEITLLDVGGNHPDEVLTLVIKGDDRKKFQHAPEDYFKDKTICVTGEIVDYKGRPEIMIIDVAQIKVTN